MMHRNTIFLIINLIFFASCNQQNTKEISEQKPKPELPKTRVIIQSDTEIDDQNSLCRLLLYANELEILGIFYNNTGGGAYEEWALDRINAYSEIRDNLLVHAKGYPTKQYLLERLHRYDEPDVAKSSLISY